MSSYQLPTSGHFELHQLAEGVYAAIAIEGGAAFSNAGIVDLGERTLIFDTFDNPKGAIDLRAAAEQLTGRPANYVVISHAHPDHWMGNQVFADHASIIATHAIRAQMLPFVQEIQSLKADPSALVNAIRENRERLEAEPDERKRASLRVALARSQHDLDALASLELRFPDQTFESRLVFHGTCRVAELITQGKGHTDSDCYLVLPADKVAFIGDLGFFASQPFMVYCDPQAWVAQMDGMQQPLRPPFDAWLVGGMNRFEANVRSAYTHSSIWASVSSAGSATIAATIMASGMPLFHNLSASW